MKNNHTFLPGGYKIVTTLIIALAMITCLSSFKNADYLLPTDPIKTVKYNRIETVSFALSTDVNSELIHPTDIVRARAEKTLATHITTIDANGQIRITENLNYERGDMKSQFKRPAKTFYDQDGMRFFNEDNIQYFYDPSTDKDRLNPIDLNNVSISNYGYSRVINMPTNQEIGEILSSGATYTINSDLSYTVQKDNMKVTFDVTNQCILQEFFKNGILDYSIFTLNSQPLNNGMTVKLLTINKTYVQLRNGGLMQRTSREEFDNYIIDGITIYSSNTLSNQLEKSNSKNESFYALSNFNAEEIKLNEDLKVWPNPSKNILHIELNTYQEESRYSIKNIQGQNLISNKFFGKSSVSLDQLAPGSYILEVQFNNKTNYKLFIKE